MASTTTLARPNRSSLRRTLFLWVSWTVIAVTGIYFLAGVVGRYAHFDAAHYRFFWNTRWWLVAHLGGGSIALVLGPFQFSSGLRRRYVRVHRWMGRLYLTGILVASIAAIYMGFYVALPRAFGVSLLFLALAWLTTSLVAYIAVLRRQFAVHREWMIRSYVVTFAFVLFRLLGDLKAFSSLPLESQLVMQTWVAWAVPLLFTEVVLQWRRIIGPPAPQKQDQRLDAPSPPQPHM